MPDLAKRLTEALGVRITEQSRTPWASVTFTGSRVHLLADQPVQDDLCAIELDTREEIIADISNDGLNITVLTVDVRD